MKKIGAPLLGLAKYIYYSLTDRLSGFFAHYYSIPMSVNVAKTITFRHDRFSGTFTLIRDYNWGIVNSTLFLM